MRRFIQLLLIIASVASCSGNKLNVRFQNNLSGVISSYSNSECTILVPVNDSSQESMVLCRDENGQQERQISIRLANDIVDYYVPLKLNKGESLVINGMPFQSPFWENLKIGNPELCHVRESSLYNFAPAYGWMNDPNGMVYKDGVYHLYYQFNPYGATWQNMSWGHAESKDLINWEYRPTVLFPDSLGMIFSGSAVVDSRNTAGFGENTIIAIYTSAGSRQVQSIAYSNDNGLTFTKYEGNPVLTSDRADFRDPKVFWHEETDKWVMILAAGNAMEIYTSLNLKDWEYKSRFGENHGSHAGVWECPDLIEMKYGDETRWVLLCSLDKGSHHGSSVQYFVGDFDGEVFNYHEGDYGWLDYGRDCYAAVTWSNAPNDRKILLGWQNNWRYANSLPLKGQRGQMTLPRELILQDYNNQIILSPIPVKEFSDKLIPVNKSQYLVDAGSSQSISLAGERTFISMKFTGDTSEFGVVFSNSNGEEVSMAFDTISEQFAVDRGTSGNVDFHDTFSSVTTAGVAKKGVYQLDVFLSQTGVECFVDNALSMTNLVFPLSDYDKMTLFSSDGVTKVECEVFNVL